MLYELAFKTKGAVVDLTKVPEQVLPRVVERHKELVQEEEDAYEALRKKRGQF
jgi:hypothetical protein